jgi:hypothetical protein
MRWENHVARMGGRGGGKREGVGKPKENTPPEKPSIKM